MKFKTETGSVYLLDRGTMGWSRTKTEKSGEIRQEFGTLIEWPDITLGDRAILLDTSVREGFDGHAVITSRVTETLEE